MNAPDTATNFFQALELAGYADALEPSVLLDHPLLAYFPRQVYDGEEIEIRIREAKPTLAAVVDHNQPSPEAPTEAGRSMWVRPVQIREKKSLDNKEMSFFRQFEELKQVAAGTGTVTNMTTRRTEIVMRIVEYLQRRSAERKHVMVSKALQGTLTFEKNGTTHTESYGLDALAAPGTAFSNAGSKIIDEMYRIFDEFENGASGVTAAGVPADTVFINNRVWARYFVPNTQFQDFTKAIPDFASQFVGVGGKPSMADPRQPFTFMGRTFVPVWGTYQDDAGSSQARWPLTSITVAALQGTQRVLEHAANRDQYCPAGQPVWEAWMDKDPVAQYARLADNMIPMIRIRERVKTCAIAS